MHKVTLLGMQVGVYFGQHTDLNQLNPEQGKRLNLLNVPELERNFLISPPGSPVPRC
jgi:Calcipressin